MSIKKQIQPRSPRVSVLMTIYNCEKLLGMAIESVLAQSFGDFELIIVDDASTDATARIAGRYDDPRIRLVRNEKNLGIAGARNKGVSLCRGKYMALIAGDDMAREDRLEKEVAFLDEHPDIGMVSSYITYITENGEHLGVRKSPLSHEEIVSRLKQGEMAVSESGLARTDWIRQVLYREKFPCAVDYDFMLRFTEKYKVAVIPEPLQFYRLNSRSITVRRRAAQLYCREVAMNFAREREEQDQDSYEHFEFTLPSDTGKSVRTTASDYYLYTGKMFSAFGNIRRARAFFLRSILINPFRLTPFALLFLSLLGKKTYSWMQRKLGTSKLVE